MDFISNIRRQINSPDTQTYEYNSRIMPQETSNTSSNSISSLLSDPVESKETPVVSSSLDFFLQELENRNFFNNKAKEQERLDRLQIIKDELVNKLKELHIENKLNPAFIKELLNAIDVTFKNFKENPSANPENFYNACLSYIDSRRPKNSDLRAHVDF